MYRTGQYLSNPRYSSLVRRNFLRFGKRNGGSVPLLGGSDNSGVRPQHDSFFNQLDRVPSGEVRAEKIKVRGFFLFLYSHKYVLLYTDVHILWRNWSPKLKEQEITSDLEKEKSLELKELEKTTTLKMRNLIFQSNGMGEEEYPTSSDLDDFTSISNNLNNFFKCCIC